MKHKYRYENCERPFSSWDAFPDAERRYLTPLDRASKKHIQRMRDQQSAWWCRHCEWHDGSKATTIAHIKEKYA